MKMVYVLIFEENEEQSWWNLTATSYYNNLEKCYKVFCFKILVKYFQF